MVRFTDDEFSRLVVYIAENYGIDLSKKRILAECRLGMELEKRNIPSLTAFLRMVETDKTGRLAKAMMNRLTTNYTFFLREPAHFDFLEKEILPRLSSQKADSFQIWCAGCSTGEECYTLAMLLAAYRDSGNWLPTVQILATDLSEQALRKAEAAQYPAASLEPVPEAWRNAYCRREGDSYQIRPAVRSMVTFRRMNLMKPHAGRGRYDLVFCRNVMIYFNDAARRQLTETLYGSLKKDGYLFIGHTELLPRGQELFTYVRPAIYQKAGDG